MKPTMVITAICLALLTGCAVGPNYHQPNVSTPSGWASPLADGETNSPVNLAAWWRNFNDTNLDSLMATAAQSNLTLRIAEAHVREARAERGVVAGGLWPSIGSSASYSRNRYGANSFPPLAGFGVPLDYNLYNAGFDAAWELDIFGGTGGRWKPPTRKLGRRNTTSATCWFLCLRKSRVITSAHGPTSSAWPSRATTSKSNKKSWT